MNQRQLDREEYLRDCAYSDRRDAMLAESTLAIARVVLALRARCDKLLAHLDCKSVEINTAAEHDADMMMADAFHPDVVREIIKSVPHDFSNGDIDAIQYAIEQLEDCASK